MKTLTSNKAFWLLLVICVVTILPFLGLPEYHTKGEPRESIVSYSMLESDNWILPRNNGGEIPYKPPFFHWTIAAVSTLNGGQVTEMTSRLPSAIALISMTLFGFLFFAKRKGTEVALLTAFITLTNFELHRAGANCRVDMVLTALTVCALYCFYRWYEKGLKGIPWLAILLMSLGTLTKGPVGTIIPCLVTGVFLLLRGVNFFRAFLLPLRMGHPFTHLAVLLVHSRLPTRGRRIPCISHGRELRTYDQHNELRLLRESLALQLRNPVCRLCTLDVIGTAFSFQSHLS